MHVPADVTHMLPRFKDLAVDQGQKQVAEAVTIFRLLSHDVGNNTAFAVIQCSASCVCQQFLRQAPGKWFGVGRQPAFEIRDVVQWDAIRQNSGSIDFCPVA